jgi:serine/threonine-protein kinase
VSELYHAALEQPSDRRAAFLQEGCAGDEELRREVESLLAAEDQTVGCMATASGTATTQTIGSPAVPALVGRTLGSYQVLSLLGAGGMGEVYLARDSRLGRNVAIKLLPNQHCVDPERVWRFEREARAASALNHPNIVTIYDIGLAPEGRYIVMEFSEGRTLRQMQAQGAMPASVPPIGGQIAKALAVAHAAGIIHRDIKPENIIVRQDGYVKVLDFGLARLLRDTEVEAETLDMTIPGRVMGTARYMSPEQAHGENSGAASDVFSLGLIFYEMATGSHPFPSHSLLGTLHAISSLTPAAPSSLNSDIPAPLEELILAMLQKDPASRPTAAEVDASLAGSWSWAQPGRAPSHAGRPVEESPPARAIASLAVLPFANASGDPQMEYLSDGLTESIILGLSHLPQLRVMSRSAVFRYKGRIEEAQVVGQALGVGAVLTGKVVQRGEMLLVSAELVDVRNGWQLWGEQYRKKVEDIFALEEDIAKEISGKLRLKLAPEQDLPARRYTDNVAAYHLYLKGRFYWAKRTEEGLYKGIQYFRQAIELDPTYALAYAGVAEGYVPLAVYCHLAPTDACPKARAAAQAALEIDPKLAEARAVLGAVLSYYEWDQETAEKELREAIALDPKYPRARQALAESLTISGRFEEAEKEARRALELDPLALSLNAFMAMTYYFGHAYDKAIEHGSRTVDMDPSFYPGYFYLGLAYQFNGQLAQAAVALQQARVLSNNSTLMVASLGGVFAAWGKHEEALNILYELKQMGSRKYVSQVFAAAIWTGLGEIDQALTCLETAYEDRCTWLPRCLTADARLQKLHGEPRLQALIRRVGNPRRQEESK